LVFAGSPFRVTEPYVARMRDVMAHRGPDGAGAWVRPDGRVGLGHRRLAIIDLSAAADQPMANEDGTLRVVFNGEIYNHAAIRAELERLGGHRWRTDHSDTEVILHAFEQWGIDCLHRFRGMFALALWDERAEDLWLVRDRIGVKPLYYSVHHGRITFASEIKALLEDPEQARAVNEEALFHYLSFLTAPAPLTLFEGVRKLPAGTWLRVRGDGHRTEYRYWDVWDHTRPLTGLNDEAIAEQVLDELRAAVRLRKVSDVPVGVFLSGGLDSSTNAALFSEGETRPIRTFSIGYRGDHPSYPNELRYARAMAAHVGAEYHDHLLDVGDLIDFLPTMVYLQDEPIADPVCVPVYYVSKLAREKGVKVCHVGEGADELFWGYEGWRALLRLQRWNGLPAPQAFKALGLRALRLVGRQDRLYYEWLRRATVRQPLFWSGAEAFTEAQKAQLLAEPLRGRFRGMTSWSALEPVHRRFREKAWELSPLHWMTYADLNLRLPELLLMRVDKMSMGVALECRVPFLDHRLVECALSIPTAVKTRHGELKHVLKKAVRGLIPGPLLRRRKQGFGVPVREWFFGGLAEMCRRELDRFCGEANLLRRQAVHQLLERGRGPQAWYLLNLALWWKRFIAGRAA
jgi:asparagine synthase (glutamine-hydrolysing)